MRNNNNHIKDCFSKLNWLFHLQVDKDTKSFVSFPNFPNKSSWYFYKKHDYDCIIAQWKMLFQASDSKERNFLELTDDDLNLIEPSTIKEGS